ncbi:uncharacterized protein [Eurosta solidaginis]|uniref:uncharacterized protein n=1 Tax=Eurosta solidaginis TaxID=178769 RepID=UPI003530CB66
MSNSIHFRIFLATSNRHSHCTNMTTQKTKQTQKQQFELLVDFMAIHPDLAKGLLKTPNAKTMANNLWKQVTRQLNAAGPPMRDITGWKKVWADYKVHLKAKMRRNKTNIAGTGGGPSVYSALTPLEQQASDLLSMDQAVDGIAGTREFGARQAMTEVPSEILEPAFNNDSDSVEMSEEENEQPFLLQQQQEPCCSRSVLTPRKKQSLLERQVDNQIEYQSNSVKVLNEINDNLKNIARTMRITLKIKNKKLKFAKEQFVHKQRMDRENLRIKLNKLEIKKQMLDVELQTNKAISRK